MENSSTIYVLDENQNSREILKSYIDEFKLDLEVKLYSDYKFAIQEIKTESTAPIVFIDISTNNRKIDEIIDSIKLLTQKIVITSTDYSTDTIVKAMRMGAKEFLPKLHSLFKNTNPVTEIIGDGETCQIIPVTMADENSFDTEFLDYKIAVKIVDDVSEAVKHISKHSTHHSESIISENQAAINYFTSRIDSAAVYVNASTRFTDGGEFGLGCEMGISTQKLHARGPMGLNELNTY